MADHVECESSSNFNDSLPVKVKLQFFCLILTFFDVDLNDDYMHNEFSFSELYKRTSFETCTELSILF